ncbi:hypothetical protein ACA040_002563 [Xenophilus aerolatus]
MIATRLTATPVFVGTVDATRDSRRPTPRSLEQCQGMQRSSTARIEPIGAAQPMSIAEKAVLVASALGGLFVLFLIALERLAQ